MAEAISSDALHGSGAVGAQSRRAKDQGCARPLVLHVPFTYFPEASGGTEVYVQLLAKELPRFGFAAAIAAPTSITMLPSALTSKYDGVTVHRFAVDPRQRMEHAYGATDEVAAGGFAAIVEQIRPAVVHLHARTAAVSDRLVDIAHARDAKVVFTYHTPTVSCARGTMLLDGLEPCDGRIDYARCVSCAMAAKALPPSIARLAATVPPGLAQIIASLPMGRPLSGLRVPGLIRGGHARFGQMMAKADHVIAVCEWVAQVLRNNGITEPKLSISRQGVAGRAPRGNAEAAAHSPRQHGGAPIRLAYFGRVDDAKGVDLIGEALTLLPGVKIEANLHLVRQPGTERVAARIEDQARRDDRLRLCAPLAPQEVGEAMAHYDIIAVPSRWMETGPLVVLEAFAAGVPVVGARRGGIAELVRDDINGLLFEAGDAAAFAAALRRIVDEPTLLARLRAGVPSARTMFDVACDMAGVYRLLIGSGSVDAAALTSSTGIS